MVDDNDYIKNKMWSRETFMSFSTFEDAYFKKLANKSVLKLDRNMRILEIGFGNGNLLGWLKSQGIEDLHGVEINKILLKNAACHNIATYETIEYALTAGPFNVIFALDVIEHIKKNKLISLFKNLGNTVRDGDVIIIRFPNGDSPFGRINQNGDLTHEFEIGIGKLRMLCELSGLEIISLNDEPFPILNVGLNRGLQHLFILMLRKMFQLIFGAVFFQGNFLPLGPNYVCCLRKQKLPYQ
jgi:hypothetical protein